MSGNSHPARGQARGERRPPAAAEQPSPAGTAEPEQPKAVERRTVHVTLRGHCEGRALELALDCYVEQIKPVLRKLEKAGVEIDRYILRFDWTADGRPICPKHRIPMSPKEKQGDKWFSHHTTDAHGNIAWCKGYPGPDSPGYHNEIDHSTE